MLAEWLDYAQRNDPAFVSFNVIDITEKTAPGPYVTNHLGKALRDSLFDPEFLKEAEEWLGWPEIAAFIDAGLPTEHLVKLRRGSFGEALATEMMQEFYSFDVPIRKLRYRMSPGQSLPGTDVIAIEWNSQQGVTGVCFIESKLRTTSAFAGEALVEAYNQLLSDQREARPVMLKFIAERLREQNHPLFPLFLGYLRDRRDLTGLDSYRIFLVWDSGAWSESPLQNLQGMNIEVEPLAVHVARIDRLVNLVDAVYAAVPCECEPVDDD